VTVSDVGELAWRAGCRTLGEGGEVLFRRALLCVWLLLSVTLACAAEPLTIAGRVDFVVGDVWFFDPGRKTRRPQIGDPLFASDTVVTGTNGEVHLDMDDAGYLAVRPNTVVKIAAFRANGDKEDRSVLTLLQGALRSFTGWIPKVAPGGYRIETVTATIGVRGTDHESLFVPAGSQLGEPGTYEKVNEGAAYIERGASRIDVLPNQVGFAPSAVGTALRLLDAVPGFFQPGPSEHLLTERHKMVEERLQKRLEERQQQIKSKPQGQSPSGLQQAPVAPAAAAATGAALEGAGASPATAPAASVVPVSPAAAGTALEAAPASALPPAPPVPGSTAVPGAATAIVPAVRSPAAASTPAPAATPASNAIPAESSVRGAPARGRSEAAAPGVPQQAGSAVVPASNESTQSDRIKTLTERRQRQQENRRDEYERDRELAKEKLR
jgi:hypothetical protein